MKRVAFGSLVAAAVLLPLRKPATVVAARTSNNRSARYDTLTDRYYAAHIAWTAFDLRDSAMAVLAQTPDSTARPAISWRGFGATANSASADSVVTALWPRIGATHANVRTAIVIYNPQAYKAPAYQGALIVTDGDRASCVAITPGHLNSSGEASVWEYPLDRALAPCALVTAFGAPGASVGGWLATTRFAAAQSNRWLKPKDPLGDGRASPPWVEWFNRTEDFGWLDRMPRWITTVGALEAGTRAMLPYNMGGAALHCIAGEEAACVTGVLHPAMQFPAAAEMPPDLTQTSSSRLDPITVETVRPPNAAFMSRLITEFGREKFQRFWSSDLPFEQAFQSAFGESLGGWTARWSRRSWLASGEARYMTADITLGVPLKSSWLLLTAVWSAVALAIAGQVAKRRTA